MNQMPESNSSQLSKGNPNRPIILILGPTAGGKTSLSIELANLLPGNGVGGEIISADSMQVYRGMDIGTAKPTARERAQAPHHLVDIVDPNEPFTVDDWRVLAEQKILEIRSRNRWPIVVGGTNLYVRVLLEGIFEGPTADESFRREMSKLESAELHHRLQQVDPEAARRIHPNDCKRLTRALEVFHATGRPISEWQQQWNEEGPNGSNVRPDSVIVGLDWSVSTINYRINSRVRAMMEEGFEGEARRLYEAGCLGRQASEALGYKQLIAHFRGECTLAEAVERIKIETRRFARKQRTWLKRFRPHPRSQWLNADVLSSEDIVKQALTHCLTYSEAEG